MSEENCSCIPHPPKELLGRTRDLTGQVVGQLTVLGFSRHENHKRFWMCRCSCGANKEVRLDHLVDKRVLSCGCLGALSFRCGEKVGWWTVGLEGEPNPSGNRRWWCTCKCGNASLVCGTSLRTGGSFRCAACRKVTHAMSGSPEFKIRSKMIWRCCSPNCKNYKDYGGRGITVCDRWRESFENFYEDMGPRPSPKHSIDRIDNDGNYEPGNCRWATAKEQGRNKRNNIHLTLSGVRKTLPEWAEDVGIARATLLARLKKGWSDERVLTTPLTRSA